MPAVVRKTPAHRLGEILKFAKPFTATFHLCQDCQRHRRPRGQRIREALPRHVGSPRRLKLNYPDSRNQLKALEKRGLVDIVDQKGRMLFYGLTPKGAGLLGHALRESEQLSPETQSIAVATNGESCDFPLLDRPSVRNFFDKIDEIRTLLAHDLDLAMLVHHLLHKPYIEA
jgi:hypothetical protein